jgi:hypothetical protein
MKMGLVKKWSDFGKNSFEIVHNTRINENNDVELLSSEREKAEEEMKKELEKAGMKVDGVSVVWSSDGPDFVGKDGATGGVYPELPPGSSGPKREAPPAKSDSEKDSDLKSQVARAAQIAGKGLGDAIGDEIYFGSQRTDDTTKTQQVKKYFFGEEGSGPETIGGGGEYTSYNGTSNISGGITAKNQKSHQSKSVETERKKDPKLGDDMAKLSAPNYSNMGTPAYTGSEPYKDILDRIGKDRKSVIDYLEGLGIDKDRIPKDENVLIGVRSPLYIKNEYPNDFTDFLVLLDRNGDAEIFQGSTTPSPAFRYKEWYDYYVKIGFIGLIRQNGSYIIDPGEYSFSYDGSSIKSKFFGSPILTQKGNISFHKYGIGDNISDIKMTDSFDPGKPLSGNIGMSIAPALPGGGSANALDATTSGDQVLKNSDGIKKILDATKSNPAGRIKYIVVEDKAKVKSRREERKERREERREERRDRKSAEEVNESSSYRMRYLKKFGE